MTKIYENFTRTNVASISLQPEGQKGEFTVVLSEKNKDKKNIKEIHESVKIEIKKMIKKYSNKDIVEFISKKEGLPKKIIYDFCLTLKKNK
jgi:16S rRNA C1402 (ribose-2'-O) methylase RsmI